MVLRVNSFKPNRTAKEATESMVESTALAATARLPEKNAMIAFKTDRAILRNKRVQGHQQDLFGSDPVLQQK